MADLEAGSPEPVALVDRARIEASANIGPLGVVVPVLDDGERALFWARLDADERYKIVVIDGDGEAVLQGSEIARTGDDGVADIGPIAASPDGTRIAFAADERAGGDADGLLGSR